ncbi:N-acetylglutaminylglutamine amidotransferase [Aestuariispira insulae]|uniref:asparagine synthase (glutamine-hydrolyzing) n=1 Tax=Aestuariispira insulae TaxID=1461337 RepID=A0A3D9HQ55_9PROT|nr:N-acetylglutaminylglutamine amidotransferase [Aestuariispira insulae]RED51612.1 asparagine synthase (glutamine-hydrolysing) [Aestuariispira insulae]
MCGIAGIISFSTSNDPNHAQLAEMTRRLARRGPDGNGISVQGRIGLGHRRLKIVDLSDRAQQPMIDPELGLSVVFNGCIYNHAELRQQLEGMGYRFFSTGDTEVIAKAYHAWGRDCVQHFNGMFAFAVTERDSGKVMLARDRLGIKPLYISHTPERLAFASSLPALLAAGGIDTSIDPVGLNYYMSFHAVVPAPHTILNGVKKLPPATVAEFDADGFRTDTLYWQTDFNGDGIAKPQLQDEWEDQLLSVLRRSVSRRLTGDVPVGVLLSGGLDSSLITGLLAEQGQKGLNTFSIGFEDVNGEDGNEFYYSDLVAKHFGTKHHKIFVDSRNLLDRLPEVFEAQSEPMVSHDNIAFYLLSEVISKEIKVVQSGQGADEVFGGYHWYPPLVNSQHPANDYCKAFMDRDYAEYCDAISEKFHCGDQASDFVASRFADQGADDPVAKALRLDTTVMLVDDPVKRVDNMTMAWGLEARVPFLDHEVVELAARIPSDLKIKGDGKYILKEAARKVIPHEVIDRPKGYFPVPALKYLEGSYLDYVRDAVNSNQARERGIFNQAYVDRLLQSPKDHITPLRGSKLWQVALLECWLQTHAA